ncbi:excisionase family DNA-binding protein [Nocardioides zhouii]|uniref:DNA-binding protein n=1 Tax=Nocardioides zhouii TaxID=1168729 RepID=A0A4Q2SYI7_9ACTN|nr:excisionase family DNA-binding protein [Nocardioides zhouii]RYC10551.1 DNA-binding protein [Nocardioides zhouii]
MPDESPDARDKLSRVSAEAAELVEVENRHRSQAAALAQAMYEASKAGHTWGEIARAAGLASPKTARSRAERAMDAADLSPSVRWRHAHGDAVPRPAPESPGISVTEAARRLGITRNTVYAWINNGKLQSAEDHAGRPRVLLDEETPGQEAASN